MKIKCIKKCVTTCIVGFIMYVLFRFRSYEDTFKSSTYNVKSHHLWEYLSDFSIIKKINPTINNFNIESENGTYEHWKYRVHFTGSLALRYLRWINYSSWTDYEIQKRNYRIDSIQKTCFYFQFLCVHSESNITVTELPNGSSYTEIIRYECPLLFSKICSWELHLEKQNINLNLKKTLNM